MRLAKYLAHAGVASRRRSEALIASGAVTVGGEVVKDPARDVDEKSGVEVDGEPVRPEPREVWVLNKPLDVVSTAREPGQAPGGYGSRARRAGGSIPLAASTPTRPVSSCSRTTASSRTG